MSDPDENESDAEADDFLLDEFESDDDASAEDPDGSGLELGEAQAQEIRQIFMTTLPQYLEPLEELMEQALSQAEPDQTIISTLDTTVSSILAAAQRIGVDDIADSLIEMGVLIKELAVSEPDEVADELRGSLQKIKVQSGNTDAPAEASRTIVAALAEVEGFDTSILESLTAAGLVSVSQLEMARKHEILAVTGLPEESVDELLAALGIVERVGRRGGAARAIDPELERHLRTQVDAEDALGQARVQVQRTRSRLQMLVLEIERAHATARAHLVRDAAAREARARAARAQARDMLAELEARRDELEERVSAATGRLSEIERQHGQLEHEQDALRDQLSDLGERVRMLLETVDEARE